MLYSIKTAVQTSSDIVKITRQIDGSIQVVRNPDICSEESFVRLIRNEAVPKNLYLACDNPTPTESVKFVNKTALLARAASALANTYARIFVGILGRYGHIELPHQERSEYENIIRSFLFTSHRMHVPRFSLSERMRETVSAIQTINISDEDFDLAIFSENYPYNELISIPFDRIDMHWIAAIGMRVTQISIPCRQHMRESYPHAFPRNIISAIHDSIDESDETTKNAFERIVFKSVWSDESDLKRIPDFYIRDYPYAMAH